MDPHVVRLIDPHVVRLMMEGAVMYDYEGMRLIDLVAVAWVVCVTIDGEGASTNWNDAPSSNSSDVVTELTDERINITAEAM